MFDPIDLNESITPLSIRQTLYEKKDPYLALLMALKLQEKSLITEMIENIDTSKGNSTRHFCSERVVHDHLSSRTHLPVVATALRGITVELHQWTDSTFSTLCLLSLLDLQSLDESHQQSQAELDEDSHHSVQSREESLVETRQSR